MAEPRWLDETEQQAWRTYLRVSALLTVRLGRRVQEHSNLSLPDFEVLVHLTDVPETRLRISELARAMHWEKSRLSHQIARMEKRGLLTREECQDDGRGAFVSLTPAGWEAITTAAPSHVEDVRRLFFDAISDEQVAALLATFTQILNQLENGDAGDNEATCVE